MKRTLILLVVSLFVAHAWAVDGMLSISSNHSVAETANRLETVLNEKGMRIFNQVKHSEAARKVGIELKDTQLIIFGNPKAGSPLMRCAPTVALDLPQKALVWQDTDGQVWLSYNDPRYLKKRHGISGCDALIDKIGNALAGIARIATQ